MNVRTGPGAARGRGTGAALLFWCSLAAVLYTYAGYPLLLRLIARRRRPCPSPELPDPPPHVNLIVAAREEAGTIEHLLHSCVALTYPPSRLHVTVVVTGEPEPTLASVESCRALLEEQQIELRVLLGDRADPSKAAALNQAAAQSESDILVFTDANVRLDSGAIVALVRGFAAPAVGAVSGRKRSLSEVRAVSTGGDRAYWSYEAFLKHNEAQIHSTAGADGALYAVRRELYRPTVSCADDFAISLAVVEQGSRIAFAREAIAYESSTHRLRDEFQRRLRTLTCGLELLLRSPRLFSPRRPAFAWILFSHKLMRYAAAYGLIGMLAGSMLAKSRLLRALALVQLLSYTAALLGGTVTVRRRIGPVAALPLYGLAAQAAAIAAPVRLLRPQARAWTPTPRDAPGSDARPDPGLL